MDQVEGTALVAVPVEGTALVAVPIEGTALGAAPVEGAAPHKIAGPYQQAQARPGPL